MLYARAFTAGEGRAEGRRWAVQVEEWEEGEGQLR